MTADPADQRLAGRLIVTAANNFVERPWGGTRLRELKALCSLPDQVRLTGFGLGESFELAAFADDREAAQNPSRFLDHTGRRRNLATFVAEHAETLLGEDWIGKYGRCVPLLPKFLNVRELLSVQGHPPGHTEAYVVVDAEPGATIRLGFNRDVDPRKFGQILEQGLIDQRELAAVLGEGSDWFAVQRVLANWLAERNNDSGAILDALLECGVARRQSSMVSRAAELLDALKRTYWFVLDAMNEIELTPGQVIHNSNPDRIIAAGGGIAAAEVHALGNPQRREFVMLEVRRPGPTLRAWDNVRFPMREIDIAAALEVLNLSATSPEDFLCTRQPMQFDGHSISVDSPYFRIEHVEAAAGATFELTADDPHCLHVLSGTVEITTAADAHTTVLKRGESAFVPNAVTSWSGRVLEGALHLVKVHLP